MFTRTLALLAANGGLALAVSLVAVHVMADDGRSAAPEALTVANEFPFQGRIERDGVPVSGGCDLSFQLWDDNAGGAPVGAPQAKSDVVVVNGLFTTNLNAGLAFGGDARWVEITAACDGGGNVILAPRVPLLATPYALSLKPGAKVAGLLADAAITGQNTGSGPGLRGIAGAGLAGLESTSGVGVSGLSSVFSGYGGKFVNTQTNGAGVYARGGSGSSPDIVLGGISNADDNGSIVTDDTYPSSDLALAAQGDVLVDIDANDDEDAQFILSGTPGTLLRIDEEGSLDVRGPGNIKAGVFVDCRGGVAAGGITRRFATPPQFDFEYTSGPADGQCNVDFGFSLFLRYYVATATGTNSPRIVTLTNPNGGSSLDISRTDPDGTGVDGPVMILVY